MVFCRISYERGNFRLEGRGLPDQVGYRQAAFQQGPGGQALQGPEFLMPALKRANTFFWLFFKDNVGPLGPMDGPYKGW